MPRVSWLKQRWDARRVAGACAALCLVISALLLGKPSFSHASLPVRGVTDPVIAIQIARSVSDVDYVLSDAPSPDREVMRMKERIGFAFTAAYTALFFALAMLLIRSGGVGRVAGPAAMILAAATAVFNIAANVAVLRILDVSLYETTGRMINAIRSAAFASWTLASLTLLALSIYFFRAPRLLMRAIGGLFVLTALMQLIGLRDGEFLVIASAPAALALVGIAAAMLIPWKGSAGRWALLLLACTASLHAEVKHVRAYTTQEPRDRRVLFAMAVTPGGDVLSLVAKRDGKWRLTRIQNWWDKSVMDQTIDVPGIAVPDKSKTTPTFLSLLSAKLFSTADGRFAIAIATGEFANNGQRRGTVDNLVSVIDLGAFGLQNTARQQGIFEYFADAGGKLVSRELADNSRLALVAGQAGRSHGVTLRFFDLPSLALARTCRFDENLQGRTWAPHDENCGPSLQRTLAGLEPAWPRDLPAGPPCGPAGVSRNGLYRVESCQDFHRNWWGNPVVSDPHENIYSMPTGAQVGAVNETTRDRVDSRLAEHNGRDYLLVMEGGTILKVYEIADR